MTMRICLDAGHYGKYNRSPVNAAYWESEFSWKFHLLLKAELERYGVTVVTTRTEQGKDKELSARGRCAQGCDLFLSIHSNACDTESADHPLACCCVSGKADVIGRALAETVQRVMGTSGKARIWKRVGSGGADYYGVLRGAAAVGVPGVLLEHSFHTNAKATAWLLNDANLRRLAEAEAETIAAHYGLERSGSSGGGSADAAPSQNEQGLPEGAFLVRVACAELNVRKGAGVEYPVTTRITKGYVFTIVETARAKDGGIWGRLKSGAGWINVGTAYCKRV